MIIRATAMAVAAHLAAGGLAAGLAGCAPPVAGSGAEAGAETSAAPGAEAAVFESKASSGEAVREFTYSWPAEASAIPALVQQFTAERSALLAEQQEDWDAALQEFAGSDCAACTNRALSKQWGVAGDIPRFLVLSASIYSYTGGAHGNAGYDAVIWDREAGARMAPEDLFVSPAALQSALGAAWCDALADHKREKLGEDYTGDSFFPCPPIADLTVLPTSSDGVRFDSVALIAAPYVAGSWAEGSYEAAVPVTPLLREAVRAEFRAYFAAHK
ncbi:MAG: DUF4163 domain-containing protein [Erythrobacter sp.]